MLSPHTVHVALSHRGFATQAVIRSTVTWQIVGQHTIVVPGATPSKAPACLTTWLHTRNPLLLEVPIPDPDAHAWSKQCQTDKVQGRHSRSDSVAIELGFQMNGLRSSTAQRIAEDESSGSWALADGQAGDRRLPVLPHSRPLLCTRQLCLLVCALLADECSCQ